MIHVFAFKQMQRRFISMKLILKPFLLFLRNGTIKPEKITLIFFLTWLASIFIFNGVALAYLLKKLEYVNLIEIPKDKEVLYGPFYSFISILLIAPLVEELIFRYFLISVIDSKKFLFYFYFSSFLFAVIHSTNYEITSANVIFTPLIFMSPFIGGLVLGYFRVKFGFWFAVLLHSSYNLLIWIWDFFIGF